MINHIIMIIGIIINVKNMSSVIVSILCFIYMYINIACGLLPIAYCLLPITYLPMPLPMPMPMPWARPMPWA